MLCNMTYESGVCLKIGGWRSALIVALFKDKGKRPGFINCRCITLLIVVGKIYARILLGIICRITGGLIDDEQEGFRSGRRFLDQIFTLKQIGKKAREKKAMGVCGFYAFREDVR